eukprot:GHVL01034658.1.p1 GENE.GHVL01034658.1~~GHVL01034658.1.p1  ORF type:complete len:196 (+),score=22.91 GHVL01034658.1:142-729(+)
MSLRCVRRCFQSQPTAEGIPYLARPIINIHNQHETEASWRTQQQIDYSKILFSKGIAAHPAICLPTLHKMKIFKIPQVAFAGYSNVGKSSLINSLLYGKQLGFEKMSEKKKLFMPKVAPVSNTPGRTRHVFQFDLGDHLSLVDLPGFGFARVPEKQRLAWGALIHGYFDKSIYLKRVISLIDVKEGIRELDETLW